MITRMISSEVVDPNFKGVAASNFQSPDLAKLNLKCH